MGPERSTSFRRPRQRRVEDNVRGQTASNAVAVFRKRYTSEVVILTLANKEEVEEYASKPNVWQQLGVIHDSVSQLHTGSKSHCELEEADEPPSGRSALRLPPIDDVANDSMQILRAPIVKSDSDATAFKNMTPAERQQKLIQKEDRILDGFIKEIDEKLQSLMRVQLNKAMTQFDRKAKEFKTLRDHLVAARAVDAAGERCDSTKTKFRSAFALLKRRIMHRNRDIKTVSSKEANLMLLYQSGFSHLQCKEKLLLLQEQVGLPGDAIQDQQGLLQMRNTFSIADYEIIRKIDEGGSSKVLLGRRWGQDKLHAIKVMNIDDIRTRNMSKRVQQEREILSRLVRGSPFVVTLFNSFHDDSNLYMVMEFVNGGDLLTLLKRVGMLEESHAIFCVAELVMALKFLHSSGIIHRDIKPANILVTEQGHLKVADFGLSQVLNDNTAATTTYSPGGTAANAAPRRISGPGRRDMDSGTTYPEAFQGDESDSYYSFRPALEDDLRYSAVGTIDYLAPEVIFGCGHSYTVDWWSAGVVFFQMLTNRLPFNPGYDSDEDRDTLFENIVEGRISWPGVEPHEEAMLPPRVRDKIMAEQRLGADSQAFLSALLVEDKDSRLGCDGAESVQAHHIFSTVRWDDIHVLPSPMKEAVDKQLHRRDRSRKSTEGASSRQVYARTIIRSSSKDEEAQSPLSSARVGHGRTAVRGLSSALAQRMWGLSLGKDKDEMPDQSYPTPEREISGSLYIDRFRSSDASRPVNQRLEAAKSGVRRFQRSLRRKKSASVHPSRQSRDHSGSVAGYSSASYYYGNSQSLSPAQSMRSEESESGVVHPAIEEAARMLGWDLSNHYSHAISNEPDDTGFDGFSFALSTAPDG